MIYQMTAPINNSASYRITLMFVVSLSGDILCNVYREFPVLTLLVQLVATVYRFLAAKRKLRGIT